MRPFTSTISLDEARRRLDAARPADRAHRARARSSDAAGRVAAADVDVADRRAAVRALRDGRLRRRRRRHRRRDAIDAGASAPASIASTPASRRRSPIAPRHVRGDRDRRAAARRRRRRGDGRGDRADGDDDVEIFARGDAPASTSAGAAPTSPPAIASSRAGDLLTPEPRRRARRDRPRRRRGVREAARRDPLDRQRSGRAGRHAGAGPDLRRQPLHARRRSSRRTAASPSRTAPAQDTVDALIDALDACADADLIVFSGGSSVGERDLIVDAIARPRRDDLSRHRGQAGQADGVRASVERRTPFFGMPGNPTSCLSNAYILLVPFLRATRAAAAARAAHRPRAARPPHRVGGRTGISSTRSACATASRFPAFKGSGDITSLSQADGYIEIPADQSVVEEGASVDGHALLNR